jgi:hypothetical protein
MRFVFTLIVLVSSFQTVVAGVTVDFEVFPLGNIGYFNGPTSNAIPIDGPFGGKDFNGTFEINGIDFFNSNNDLYRSWSGFAVSNRTDTTTAGFGNQYSSFAGSGAGGSSNYAVATGTRNYFNLPADFLLSSVALSNTTYAALSMMNGDSFAKKFGGVTGVDPDFLRVTLRGFDSLNGLGNSIGSVTVDLADFTFSDNTKDYILSNWLTVDLSLIANARSVSLDWASSDVGSFGINTPTFVALDNLTLTAVPEPSSVALIGLVGLGATWWRRRKQNQKQRR